MLHELHRTIRNFVDRKAIRRSEAYLSPRELAIFRRERKARPWRDAYRAIIRKRDYLMIYQSEPACLKDERLLDAAFDNARSYRKH
jgi:hypothetical protein